MTRRELLLVFVAAALVFSPMASLAAQARPLDPRGGIQPAGASTAPNYSFEFVASDASGPPRITVGPDNFPRVLYCPAGEAWYAVRAPSGWTSEFVTTTPGGGGCGALALDMDGTPFVYVVSKPSSGPSAPVLWERTPGGWVAVPGTVASGSIAVDAWGRLHMVAEEPVPNGSVYDHYLHYAMYDGTQWTVSLLDFMGTTGFSFIGPHWEDVRVDAAGAPHLAYYDPIRGDVRYAFRDTAGWHFEVIEHVGFIGAVGRQGSLALDSAGNARASYFVLTGPALSDLRYAVRSAGSWAISVLDTQGSSPALAIGPDGLPQVVYVRLDSYDPSRSHSETRLVHAVHAGGLWSFDTVLSATFDGSTITGTAAQFPSLAVDGCGHPHLAYSFTQRTGNNVTGSGVYYAKKGELCGSSPPELKHEAIQRIKALKDQALARGDKRFVHELDESEEEVWESLGFREGFRPSFVAALPGVDVTAKPRDHDKVRLALGPSWDGRLASYKSLRIAWSNGVVTVINLPQGWSTRDRDFHVTPWVDSWHQDFRIYTERDRKNRPMTLDVHTHEASLNFAISFDGDLVSQLVFSYSMRHLWVDATHLDPKHGERVFNEEGHAVRELLCGGEGDDGEDDDSHDNPGALGHDDHDHEGCGADPGIVRCRLDPLKWTDAERAVLNRECTEIANLLAKADETLALAALEEARATPIQNSKHVREVQHEIERAERELKKASSEWDEHDYNDAIHHFGEAWEHAQHAMEEAANR